MILRVSESEAGRMGLPYRASPIKANSRAKQAAATFERQLIGYRLPAFEREHKFATSVDFRGKDGRLRSRRWRFDFALPQYWLAIEVEGLVVRKIAGQLVVGGRHATITGFIEDARKYATAAMLGWTVLRFPQAMVFSKEAILLTQQVLAERGWIRP